MLVELSVSNYVTHDDFMNGVDSILKTLATYCDKTIIWIRFPKIKLKH